MIKYSQLGQDQFVLSFFSKDYKGIFVDIGCSFPDDLNNTLRLEENGWSGISLDCEDYRERWEKERQTPFIWNDALTLNYQQIFEDYDLPKIIDYLTIDIEGNGQRFQALTKIIDSGYNFKIITIEHDVYRGYELTEQKPQREYLKNKGYFLLCANVSLYSPLEDWWINTQYFNINDYSHLICENTECVDILKRIKT